MKPEDDKVVPFELPQPYAESGLLPAVSPMAANPRIDPVSGRPVSDPLADSKPPLTHSGMTAAPNAQRSVAVDEELTKQAVRQAKQIIRETRQDPYLQAVRLNQLRTDYQAQRFGQSTSTEQAV